MDPGDKQDQTNQIWVANTQVNFCAKAFPTVSSGHPDAPALTVLGAYLRNGFLHRAIREQGGAYGVVRAMMPTSGRSDSSHIAIRAT